MARGGRLCAALLLLSAALVSTLAFPPSGPEGGVIAAAPPGGAPPPGSGTVRGSAAVRVLDGDTFITWIAGRQTAVRIAGIAAPPYTTTCGAAATARLWKLVAGGDLILEEDAAHPGGPPARTGTRAGGPRAGGERDGGAATPPR